MKYDTGILIGEGGMGEVLKVWDPVLQRHVALKLLRRSDPETVERAFREARAQARINHPNVAEVFEVGTLDERPYIAMQLIEGRSLDEAAASLPIEGKVRLVKMVAEAIQAAHAAGLIHRDLKPANILVEKRDDGTLHPYVLDFGLVREQAVAGLTVTGQVLGTPGYLSPEQARGETSRLDRRTDVFSLGVILYELCAGHSPFANTSVADTLVNVLQNDPPPLRKAIPEVPRDLDTIVHCCLEKDPERRYQSARALAEDLGRYLDGEPIGVRPPGVTKRLARNARKHPIVTLLAAAVVVISLVFGGLVWRERRLADERALLAQTFGQGVERSEAILRRAYTLPLHDVRPERALVRSRLFRIRERMESLGPQARGPGCYALGRGLLALGESEAARRELERAWQADYRTPEVAYALGRTLGELYRQGLDQLSQINDEDRRAARRAELEQELREPMLRYLEAARAAEEESPEFVYGLAAFYDERWDEAIRHAREAFAAFPWLYEAKKLEGDAYSRQAHLHHLAGDFQAAAENHRRAREAYAVAMDIARSDPALYDAECGRRLLATVMELMKDPDANVVFSETLAICRQGIVANPELPSLWRGIANLYWRWAEILHFRGQDPRSQIAEAIAAAEEAIALDPGEVSAYTDLATSYLIRAEYEFATGTSPLNALDRAIDVTRQVLKIQPLNDFAHSSIADAFFQRAVWQASHGQDPRASFTAAVESLNRAVEIRPIYAWYGNLARVHLERGRFEASAGGDPVPFFEAAIANGTSALEANPGVGGFRDYVALAWLGIAEALRERGADVSEAVAQGLATVARMLEEEPENQQARELERKLQALAGASAPPGKRVR